MGLAEGAELLEKRYDLAISFAGEDRCTALDIATRMTARGYKVFYDEFERADLWGKDLTVVLGKVYMEASAYCLILASAHYARKPWTNHERQFALARALQERRPYILPLMLDGTKLDGLSPTVGYLDLRNSSLDEVCSLIAAKLGDPGSGAEASDAPLSQSAKSAIRDVLAACYRRSVFTRYHAQLNHEAMFRSLSECRGNLQRLIMYVEPLVNRRLVAGIIAELDLIERINAEPFTWAGSGTAAAVDGSKLRIISAMLELARNAEIEIAFPQSITEELFWKAEEADLPPEGHETWEGWIGGCGGFKG